MHLMGYNLIKTKKEIGMNELLTVIFVIVVWFVVVKIIFPKLGIKG